MDKLPQEILNHIASYIPANDVGSSVVRPSIACVSRRWQQAVEHFSFRFIRLLPSDIDKFATVFSTSQYHRRRMLRVLRLSIELPPMPSNRPGDANLRRLEHNAFASKALTALFNVLAGWEADSKIAIDFGYDIFATDDHLRFGPESNGPDIYDKDLSYIEFSTVCQLPKLPFIKSIFTAHIHAGGRVHPASLVAITTRVGHLERIDWDYDEPGVYLGLAKEMRREFTRALETHRLPSETGSFGLFMLSRDFEHSERLPDFASPNSHDPFCSALHHFINNSNLEDFEYEGQVDESLFWSYDLSYDATETDDVLWPAMQRLWVRFKLNSPGGKWYFEAEHPDDRTLSGSNESPLSPDDPSWAHKPPSYYGGSEEERAARHAAMEYYASALQARGTSRFRSVPKNEHILPLLSAFARALARMPALKSAHLTTSPCYPGYEDEDCDWTVDYVAPWETVQQNDAANQQSPHVSAPRVFFDTGGWRPSKEVLKLFAEIGRKAHDQDTSIIFVSHQAAEDENEVEGDEVDEDEVEEDEHVNDDEVDYNFFDEAQFAYSVDEEEDFISFSTREELQAFLLRQSSLFDDDEPMGDEANLDDWFFG